MDSIANRSVSIQSTAESVPSTPSWFGEVALMAAYLRKHGILTKISEHVRFARRRFGHYEVIDFVAVLFGYAISGERTLEEFYERLQPFAVAFTALFERDRLPSRSALSRFLAALTPEPVEALRTRFLEDLLRQTPDFGQQPCGLTDRRGKRWKVFDIDGTKIRQQGNVPCHRHKSCLLHTAVWERCVQQAIQVASGERLCVVEQPFYKRIRTCGSGRLAIQGTEHTARSYAVR